MKPGQTSHRPTPTPAPTISGVVADGFEDVRDEFERNFRDRGEVGAALSVVRRGTLVVDLWGGVRDARHGTTWAHDTIAPIFSGSKGLVAVCMLLLVERNQLRLDDPVCSYWPEFAAAGKAAVKVRHVVSHQAGLPALMTPVSNEQAADPNAMAQMLAAQPLAYSAGTKVSYHAFTYGWLCGELVRRITGESIGTFFRRNVADPLELDAWIGIPGDLESRVAFIERPTDPVTGRPLSTFEVELSDPVTRAIVGNPPRYDCPRLPWNTHLWHQSEIPAANAIASALAMARLYGCLAHGGELGGARLLAASTIERGRQCLASGPDAYFDAPQAFGTGFQLQTETHALGPPDTAFGHYGAGGSMHCAWPDEQIGISYVMNKMKVGPDPRAHNLLEAIYRDAAQS
jgi:CubicO group peptidase (beta-lactamase class C family)